MSITKNTMIRTAAAAAATVLMTAGAMGPAVAEHDRGKGKSNHGASHQAKAEKSGTGHKSDKGASEGKAHGDHGSRGSQGKGDERGNGHTPVTVCHLLGNGSYNLLTFDDNALDAHIGHGDLYPVPADGCPTADEAPEETVPGAVPGEDTPVEEAPVEEAPVEEAPVEEAPVEEVIVDDVQDDAVIAGVDAFDSSTQENEAEVLGAEATRSANRAPAVMGPLAGVLPQTGAAQVGLAAAAGLALLGAGAAMIARRRTQGVV